MKNGQHAFSETLKKAKKPLIILGAEQFGRKDGAQMLSAAQELAKSLGDTTKVCSIIYNRKLLQILGYYLKFYNCSLQQIGKFWISFTQMPPKLPLWILGMEPPWQMLRVFNQRFCSYLVLMIRISREKNFQIPSSFILVITKIS